jgi:probable phosphomutase (TIGR03848 family)
MALLFLVRHGLTAQTGKVLYGRTRGIDLDARGRAQADALAVRLGPLRPTAIYSSPLERCRQTVEPLSQTCHLPIRLRDELIEMDAGRWTGRSLSQLRRSTHWRTVQGTPSAFRFPGGGEGFVEAYERVVAEAERIARRHRNGRVVVATHGDLVRILVAHYAGVDLDGFQRFGADTASVSVVTTDGAGRSQVLLINDTGDLSRFGPPRPGGRGPRKLRG